MSDPRSPYVDKAYRRNNRIHFAINTAVFASLSINAWVVQYYNGDSQAYILGVIFLCLVPLAIFDSNKGNSTAVSSFLMCALFIYMNYDYITKFQLIDDQSITIKYLCAFEILGFIIGLLLYKIIKKKRWSKQKN